MNRLLLTAATLVTLFAAPASAQLRIDWVSQPSSVPTFDRLRVGPDGSSYALGGGVLVRIAPGGATLWQRTLPDALATQDLAVAADGAVYTVLKVRGADGMGDVRVDRTEPSGTPGWSVTLDGPNTGPQTSNGSLPEEDTPTGLVATPDGGVAFVAASGFGTQAGVSTWTVKFTASGSVLWQRTYDYTDAAGSSTGWDRPQQVATDCAGNVTVAGYGSSGGAGYVASYAPDGSPRSAVVTAFTGPGGAPAETFVDEMHVACDGTTTLSGYAEVDGAGRSRAFVARIAAGGAGFSWTVLPFADRFYNASSRTDLGVDAEGRTTVQASLYAPDYPTTGIIDNAIAHLDATGALRWAVRQSRTSSNTALAVNTETVYVSGGYTATPGGAYAPVHQAFSAVDGALLGEVPFATSAGGPRNQGAAVDPSGGYVVIENSQIVRVTTASPGAAELQVIHASAAIAAFGPLEVYLNQPHTSTTPDATVSFRGGSAFLTVPAGQPLDVRVRLVNPPPFGLPREVSFTAPPLPSGRFVASLAGIPEQILALYAQNPDGINRALQLLVTPVGSGFAGRGGVPVVVTNAVTDAPAVDVVVLETGRVLASGLRYGQTVAAASLAPGTYTVSVRRASDGASLSASRFVIAADDASAVFTVSGFVTPSANQNGPGVAVTATDETGVVNPGTPVAGEDGAASDALALDVANPVRGSAVVHYVTAEAGPVRLAAFDVLGREVAVLADGPETSGAHAARLDGLAPGVYVLRMTAGAGALSRTITVVR